MARYNVGIARADVFPASSKMAVLMMAMVATRARALHSAPSRADCLFVAPAA
ncbi:MAG: hypothetical protein RQM92_11920 [Candidatus Syntrophopropionicum ammoniitolerans]